MSLDMAKHEGCVYREDGEKHSFRCILCHHTLGSWKFSSYATPWRSPALLVIKNIYISHSDS